VNVKSFEKKEKSTGELIVEVTAEEFDGAVNEAYRKNRNQIAVPGFRKGKAPRKIIENMYGASIFFDDALDILYPKAYGFGVEQEKLSTVGQPAVLDVDVGEDKTVVVKYSVSLYPEVAMGEYLGVHAEKPEAVVTEEEIDSEITSVRQRNARIQTAERASKMGDTVVIDYEGFMEGIPFEGGKAEGTNLILGSDQFIPGFEEQLEGKAAGDEREIDLVFPNDYTDEFAGKPVKFRVKVVEVKESLLPELDDEFAKDVSEFDTLEEYKNSVQEKLAEKKTSDAERAYEDNIMTKVIENMECELPEIMIAEQIDTAISNFNYNLSRQGMDVDLYLKMMHVTMDTFRENMRPSAEKQLKIGLALEKIAELEKIEATEEEIEEGYQKMAERYGVEPEAAKDALNVEVIVREVKLRKASELVCDSAVAEKPEAKARKNRKQSRRRRQKTRRNPSLRRRRRKKRLKRRRLPQRRRPKRLKQKRKKSPNSILCIATHKSGRSDITNLKKRRRLK
jgi:trigger factor